MKLEPREYELLFEFLNNSDSFSMYDEKNNCVLQMRNLDKNALTFTSAGNEIMAFNIKDTHFLFDFYEYEVGGSTINFFKKDGYILEVLNMDGREICDELYEMKK
jgi:hypothetical protein